MSFVGWSVCDPAETREYFEGVSNVVVVKAARKNDSDGPLADFGSTAMFTHHQYVGLLCLLLLSSCQVDLSAWAGVTLHHQSLGHAPWPREGVALTAQFPSLLRTHCLLSALPLCFLEQEDDHLRCGVRLRRRQAPAHLLCGWPGPD